MAAIFHLLLSALLVLPAPCLGRAVDGKDTDEGFLVILTDPLDMAELGSHDGERTGEPIGNGENPDVEGTHDVSFYDVTRKSGKETEFSEIVVVDTNCETEKVKSHSSIFGEVTSPEEVGISDNEIDEIMKEIKVPIYYVAEVTRTGDEADAVEEGVDRIDTDGSKGTQGDGQEGVDRIDSDGTKGTQGDGQDGVDRIDTDGSKGIQGDGQEGVDRIDSDGTKGTQGDGQDGVDRIDSDGSKGTQGDGQDGVDRIESDGSKGTQGDGQDGVDRIDSDGSKGTQGDGQDAVLIIDFFTFDENTETDKTASSEKATASAEMATGSAEMATGSSKMATGSAKTATGSAKTATGSAKMATSSAKKATSEAVHTVKRAAQPFKKTTCPKVSAPGKEKGAETVNWWPFTPYYSTRSKRS